MLAFFKRVDPKQQMLNNDIDYIDAMMDYAVMCESQGDTAAAERCLNKALAKEAEYSK